jgi:tetratricopeptide (TPR) repeat protein
MRFAGLLALAVLALGAPAGWLRLRSPHFELLTDASEKSGRALLAALEQIREVFREPGGPGKASPLPVRVYLFASPGDYRRYQPAAPVKGFYQGGPDANHIVLLASGAETRRIAFHEYVHLVLNHSAVRLPQWFEEGVAEFYSTLEVRGGKVVVGRLVESHVRLLSSAEWLDEATLVAVTRRSPLLDEAARAGIFYAQSWALVHMLTFLEPYRGRLSGYAALLADGEPAAPAFRKVFGRTMSQALDDLRGYLAGGRFPVAELGQAPPEPAAIAVTPLPEPERELALMQLQLELGLWDASEEALRRLARARGPAAEVETARAKLAMVRKDLEAARGHFEAAIAAGSREPSTYFEYAMLLRDTGGDRHRVAGLLEKTIELNPYHAEAHFLLGRMAMEAGRLEEGLEHLRQAAEILPRQAGFWHALALAYHKTGRRELAQRAARRSLEAAWTEQERQMAQAALELVGREPTAPPLERPAVTTPPSWFPRQGDRRIEGTLEHLECLGTSARLRLRSGGRPVALWVESPDRVTVKAAGSVTFELACGEQPARAVAVEYLAAPDAERGVEGVLTAIELR